MVFVIDLLSPWKMTSLNMCSPWNLLLVIHGVETWYADEKECPNRDHHYRILQQKDIFKPQTVALTDHVHPFWGLVSTWFHQTSRGKSTIYRWTFPNYKPYSMFIVPLPCFIFQRIYHISYSNLVDIYIYIHIHDQTGYINHHVSLWMEYTIIWWFPKIGESPNHPFEWDFP